MTGPTWMPTRTGRTIDLLEPDSDQIEIADISEALAKQCRFNGHCRDHYSVAQHSVLVASHLPRRHRIFGLLHDAHEAYMGDILAPVKNVMGGILNETQERLDAAIATRYHLPHWYAGARHATLRETIKAADQRALVTEWRDILSITSPACPIQAHPFLARVIPWTWHQAHDRFLHEFAVAHSDWTDSFGPE